MLTHSSLFLLTDSLAATPPPLSLPLSFFPSFLHSDPSQGFSLDDTDSDSPSNTADGGLRRAYPWSNYSLPQLRELLRQRGQLSTGSKSVLKKRLKNLERTTGQSDTSLPPATTIDITSKHLSQALHRGLLLLNPESPTMGFDNDYDDDHSGTTLDHALHPPTPPVRSRISSRSNSFSAHFTGKEEKAETGNTNSYQSINLFVIVRGHCRVVFL